MDVAENLTYTISQLIPTDVTDYQSFVLSDTYDSQLQLLSDEKEILAGILIDGESAKDVDATYSADAAKANFKVMFTPSELVKYAGKTISFKVKMAVKPGSTLGKDITNTVDFENNFTPINTPKEHKQTIETYGKQFIKTEWLSGNKLAGAEFVVQKDNTFLQYVDDKQERVASITGYADAAKYNVTWVKDQAEATKLVSDNEGSFGVQGIEQKANNKPINYKLKETKAPTGHVILKNATSFTADDGKEVLEVANHSKGILPHTGGTGIIAFVVAGLAIISVSVIYFKKRRGEQLV
ncbi:isopeptide-forming domain-containing fimbrial protein [Enterococcus hailinensis]|uniref:isopeptide-forming domain-containing fimbrial protein n=1 Tax=Enterococcus hailinensis TaxID=3238988 RepID=UPI0038B289B3